MSDRRYTFNLAAAEIAGSALRITVPRKEWDRFFDIIRKFAAENGFKHHIRRVKEDVDLFFIDLWRDDLAIHCVNHSRLEDFELSFLIDPSQGGSVARIDEVSSLFKVELAAVPGVTVSARSERK